MNLTKRTVLGALLTSLAAPSALAEGRQIEEVIVTAERQEASIQDTSISITAFTGEFIDDFGIRNQEDLQNFVPATTIQPMTPRFVVLAETSARWVATRVLLLT